MSQPDPLFPPVDTTKAIFLSGNVPSSKNSKEIGFYYLPPSEDSKWFFKLVSANNPNGVLKKIRPNLRNSELTEKYIKEIAVQIIENKKRFQQMLVNKSKPYFIQLHFVRNSKREWDFHNAVQVIADCISGHYWKDHPQIPHITTQWIEDDNVNQAFFIPPLEPPHYSIDAQAPGVWISVV